MKFKIVGPRGGLLGRGTAKAVARALPKILGRFRRIRVMPDAVAKPARLTMYDSIQPSQIPLKAVAVAGYVNGRWPTFVQLRKQFPHARLLSVAVSAAADADCLDVEAGDATVAQVGLWVRRQQARGVARPTVYCSVSSAPSVLDALARSGIARTKVRLWTAHYTGKPHLCSTAACGYACGDADATQWTDRALGRNLDASLCAPDFFEVKA